MKKLLIVLVCILLAGCAKSLPAPETASGIRGESLGIDANVNEATIDNYLGREDAVYRDMRMLKDDADYEAIGGDSYLSGFVKGFEVVPYPYLVNVTGLPEDVGASYAGPTLFTDNGDGTYTANYEESMDIIHDLFPEDKTIFLMCGGGGYAGMTKTLLVALGYDADKIYNTGGYWYYDGENKVQVKTERNGEVCYDFWKVPYHSIDFETLHAKSETIFSLDEEYYGNTGLIAIESLKELAQMESDEKSFALYVYMPGCTTCAAFKPVFNSFIEKYGITAYSISSAVIGDNKENSVMETITYAPSVLLYKKGVPVASLDAMSNDDAPYYKTVAAFKEWWEQYCTLENAQC